MSRGNDVFQVLVPKGNQAILAKDLAIASLAVGQLGVFSYKDNLSLDATSTDLLTRGKAFYLAVGVDTKGGAVLNDINKSAGTHIQARNAIAYSGTCYSPGQEKIIVASGMSVVDGEQYGFKFEIRNQQGYRVHGYNQIVKSFVATAIGTDVASLLATLVTDINADQDGLILAEILGAGSFEVTTAPTADGTATITLGAEAAINVALLDLDTVDGVATKIAAAINGVAGSDYSATATGAVVSISGGAGAVVFAAGTATSTAGTAVAVSGTASVRFTVQSEDLKSYCSINLNYFAPRQTDILPVMIGFSAAATFTTVQDISYESGAGYDVKQMEYEAGGWNARPGTYRIFEDGMGKGIEYFADATGKYNIFQLSYDQASIAGWMEHKNNLRTVIAIPTADTTARDGIVAVLDAILAGTFEPLAAFATACPSDGVTVNGVISSGESFGDSIGTV